MKTFMINLGLVYLGGFSFYIAVVLWFNRPSLRRQLRVLHNLNDGNVAYSNGLNATIRDLGDKLQQNAYTIKELTEANQTCWFDAIEQGNVISMYDDAAGESRREIERLQNRNTLQVKRMHQLSDEVAHHEITINEYRKLLKEARDAVLEAQVEVRKSTEALEFLKSELVMAERQLERLS